MKPRHYEMIRPDMLQARACIPAAKMLPEDASEMLILAAIVGDPEKRAQMVDFAVDAVRAKYPALFQRMK